MDIDVFVITPDPITLAKEDSGVDGSEKKSHSLGFITLSAAQLFLKTLKFLDLKDVFQYTFSIVMVFKTPSWVPKLPFEPPDNIPIPEFINNQAYGRCPLDRSKNPFTCSKTGKSYDAREVAKREDYLARGLRKHLTPEELAGSEWNRVVTNFSYNCIDYVPATHAVHRLSGIVAAASAEYSAADLEYQLRQSGCKTIFTCVPLLPRALEAAASAGIPQNRIFLLPLPHVGNNAPDLATIEDLIVAGQDSPPLDPIIWPAGQGARQVAYLCYSSGTSGLPYKIQKMSVVPPILVQILASQDQYGRWLRTGDEVIVRKSAAGHEHLQVVDRIKELIKTKGIKLPLPS
uniref:AMP-dependent synthetase/ligase domain-containing protein n=1 Tax=Fusarium oxysporum (strain Fo5176) TaxID=660025 RepID=A0A0C4BKV3_FUSOF